MARKQRNSGTSKNTTMSVSPVNNFLLSESTTTTYKLNGKVLTAAQVAKLSDRDFGNVEVC